MKYGLWTSLREQFSKVPPAPTKDLSGKTVLIVGANTGIGYELAKHFAKMGPSRLILACRSRAKGEDALKALNYDKAELRLVDLSSFDSAKRFAETFDGDEQGIDLLMLNAGVGMLPNPSWTDDGWEQSLQVNDITLSYLAFLLLPVLKRAHERSSSPSRLVITSSSVHYWTSLEDVMNEPSILSKLNEKEYTTKFKDMGQKRYCDTKLIDLLFTRHLGSLITSSSSSPNNPWLISTCVNPGLCRSGLGRTFDEVSVFVRVAYNIYVNIVGWTAEQGSRQLVWAALATDEQAKRGYGGTIQGAYVSSMAVTEPSDFVISAKGKEAEERVWNEIIEVLTKVDGRVPGIIKEYL